MKHLKKAIHLILFTVILFACNKDKIEEDELNIIDLINSIIAENVDNGSVDNNLIYIINYEIIEQDNISGKLSELKSKNLISVDIYEKSEAIELYGNIGKSGAISIDYYSDNLILPDYYNTQYDLCDCDPTEYLCRCPLVVLDGTILKGSQISAKINALQSSDIESITVLKGEAAISLYGQLGINGVILFTTTKWKPLKIETHSLKEVLPLS